MLNELEKAIVRELQGDLPLVKKPYQAIAERLGITEEELLQKMREMKERGIIRRLGVALCHREVGFVANAMVVWIVPEERAAEVGKLMAAFPEVSHCYQRPTYPDWPYNLFTMIHAKTVEECEKVAASISQAVQVDDYQLLFSTEELKKSSMQYFME